MVKPLDGELNFSPEGNKIWTAIIGNDFIYVDQSAGVTKILHEKNVLWICSYVGV